MRHNHLMPLLVILSSGHMAKIIVEDAESLGYQTLCNDRLILCRDPNDVAKSKAIHISDDDFLSAIYPSSYWEGYGEGVSVTKVRYAPRRSSKKPIKRMRR